MKFLIKSIYFLALMLLTIICNAQTDTKNYSNLDLVRQVKIMETEFW